MPVIKYEIDDNLFCVPAAISAITGLSVAEVCKLIKEEIGDQPIRGIFYPLALKILTEKLGFQYRDSFDIRPSKTYLLHFKGHAAAVDNMIYYDNSFPSGTPYNIKANPIKIFEIFKPKN